MKKNNHLGSRKVFKKILNFFVLSTAIGRAYMIASPIATRFSRKYSLRDIYLSIKQSRFRRNLSISKFILLFVIFVFSFHFTPVYGGFFDDPDYCNKHPDDILCSGSGSTSFTEFQGEFSVPDPNIYDPNLTRTTNIRDFILKLTNFILSFLGLAAVVAIIYGGVLYVTSGGEQDSTDKAKKVIRFALTGIVVVVISFALVNTLISGVTTGEEPGDRGQVATDGGIHGSSEAISADSAQELQEISEKLQSDYSLYLASLDQYNSLAAFIESNINPEADYANNTNDFSNALDEIQRVLTSIRSRYNSLSQTSEAMNALINYIDRTFIVMRERGINPSEILQANIFLAQATVGGRNCTASIDGFNNTLCVILANIDRNKVPSDFTYEQIVDASSSDPRSILGINDVDFATTLFSLQQKIEEIQSRYESLAISEAFASASEQIGEIFIINKSFSDSKEIAEAEILRADNDMIASIVKQLGDLKKNVSEIKSVKAVIKAKPKEGNAPLTVTFDGFESEDPSGDTISDGQYSFEADCSEIGADRYQLQSFHSGATFSCVFTEPGTYVVKLTVTSSEPEKYAAGSASVRITVQKPRSNIVLKINDEVVADRSNDIDMLSYKLTLSEVSDGIKFDAKESRDGEGNEVRLCTWDFGDRSKPIKSSCDEIQTYKYGEIGRYTFTLEVEDNAGNKDKKTLDLAIGSPAARIKITPTKGDINTIFLFDGSNSRTDEGQITQWAWNIQGPQTFTQSEEGFEHQFSQPGSYDVTLDVYDSLGKNDTASTTLQVSSQSPIAAFTFTIDEPFKPNTVKFDGSKSFDPDQGDSIEKYTWTFDGKIDVDYIYLDENGNKRSEPNPESQADKEYLKAPILKFLSVGNKETTLTVEDTHGKTAATTKIIQIESILDIDLFIGENPVTGQEKLAYQLDFENVEVNFWAKSDQAVAYEMDFGDGQREVIPIPSGSGSSYAQIQHAYTTSDTFEVTLTAFDASDNENSISRSVFIGDSENPVAIINLTFDGARQLPRVVDGAAIIDPTYKTTETFLDGSKSINTDGTSRKLEYLWIISRISQKADTSCDPSQIVSGTSQIETEKSFRANLKELGCYLVELTVTNGDDITHSAQAMPHVIQIINASPTFETLSTTPKEDATMTPMKVEVKPIAANDPDGRIEKYRFWYYPSKGDSEKDARDIQITNTGATILTLNTYTAYDILDGTLDGKVEYAFGLEITDNDGNVFKKTSLDGLPTLNVKLGPNLPPDVKLYANKTNIIKGESINFTVEAIDPDSDIESYEWDFDGDLIFAQNEGPNSPVAQQVFTEKAEQGIRVSVRVMDEAGSSAVSNAVTIYVDSDTVAPVADFKIVDTKYDAVKKTTSALMDASNSKTDTGLSLDEIFVDCDVNKDSNLDGNALNDTDIKKNPSDKDFLSPVCEYDYFGLIKIQLSVKDNEGTISTKVSGLNIDEPMDPEFPIAAFTYEVNGSVVEFNGDNSLSDVNQGLTIKKWIYDFDTTSDSNGDGSPDNDEDATSSKVTHDFAPLSGTVVVKLTVEDSMGGTDAITRNIKLPQPGEIPSPEAAFTYTLDEKDPLLVTFDVSNSISYSGALKYAFDFDTREDSSGNGNPDDDKDKADTETPPKYSKKYEDYGTYNIKLTVSDTLGQEDIVTRSIEIKQSKELPPPQASFSYSLDRDNNLKAYFNVGDSFSYANPDTLEYAFDLDTEIDSNKDGKSDNDNEKPSNISGDVYTFVLSDYGTHNVSLTIKDINGKTALTSHSIFIPEPEKVDPPFVAFTYEQVEGKAVINFKGNALSYVANDPSVKVIWDLNMDEDSDGNGKKDDDSDATTVTLQNEPFDGYGTYKVKLTAIDALDQKNSVTRTVYVLNPGEEPSPTPPIAAFMTSIVDRTVTFTNTSEIAKEVATKVKYLWDFDLNKDSNGDGLKDNDKDSENQNPTMTYDDYGAYQVKLTVTDDLQRSDEVSQSVFLSEPAKKNPPVAAFTYQISDKKVTFTNTSQADEGASLEKALWDFDLDTDKNGDGNSGNDADSTEFHPSYEYLNYGSYKVQMTIYDDQGNSSNITHTIFLAEVPHPLAPEAAFTYVFSEADTKAKTVIFDGTNSKVDPAWASTVKIEKYQWDFDASVDDNGNGDPLDDYESGNPISHTFKDYKTFSVKLVVVDSFDGSGEISRTITITKPESSSLDARLTSDPKKNVTDGKIHLQDAIGYISFDYSGTIGEISEFIFDKNIYFDTNGNGVKDDDMDLGVIIKNDGSFSRSDSFKNIEYLKEWGTITSRLTVKDEGGKSDKVDIPIVFDEPVATEPPSAAFLYTIDAENPLKVTFDASTSVSESGIDTFTWDFDLNQDFDGDGKRDNDKEGSGMKVEKTFAKESVYNVKLTVIDKKGQSDSVLRTLTIPKEEDTLTPQAAFTYEVDSNDATGLKINFDASNSLADSDHDLTITTYVWDMDLSKDSNGNGVPDDDKDTEGKKIVYTFKDYKTFQVKLTVTDSKGKSDNVSRSITIEKASEELDARLITSPETNVSDGKVHLKGDSGVVNFDFTTSIGPIVKYWLDKNIYYDTNGNGVKNDDQDLSATAPGKWTNIGFEKEWGRIVSKLTVEDGKGRSDYVNVEILFDDPNALATNIVFLSGYKGVLGSLALIVILSILSIRFKKQKWSKKINNKR